MYRCLQPLGICLSHSGTLKIMDRLSSDHDKELLMRKKSLEDTIEVIKKDVIFDTCLYINYNMIVGYKV